MKTLGTWGFSSFGFSFFKWFFSAKGENCSGFDGFPTFGLNALKWTWSYDFSLTYIGVGEWSLLSYCHTQFYIEAHLLLTTANYVSRDHLTSILCTGNAGSSILLLFLHFADCNSGTA